MTWHQPAERTREDHCSCPKPADCWGSGGWHYRPHERYPETRSMGVVYEACPAYQRAVERNAVKVPQKGRR